jgi:hypothetical protein
MRILCGIFWGSEGVVSLEWVRDGEGELGVAAKGAKK